MRLVSGYLWGLGIEESEVLNFLMQGSYQYMVRHRIGLNAP